jgi:hypothetical protein
MSGKKTWGGVFCPQHNVQLTAYRAAKLNLNQIVQQEPHPESVQEVSRHGIS